jgi:multiple sugar transport system ATP-binding protein
MAEIGIRGVRKTFARGKVTAVSDVNLTIRDGELFVLLGPSGSGKTTLLRMIAGLEFADAGTITIGGRDVTTLPPRKRDLAMVFQNYAVFPHLTVRQNIAFGLRMKGEDKKTITERTALAADLVELSDLLDRRPAQLSGGQRQRVGVARAIAAGPSVLLMDEPLSNLDALLRLKFRSDLKRIVHELKTTTIYVTHDQVEALSLGDRMAVLRDGEIIQVDTPLNVYDRPADTFVGGFIGSPPMNFLPVALAEESGTLTARVGEHSFPVAAGLRNHAGKPLLAGIRGENVVPSAERQPGAVPATVKVIEPLGAQLLITVTIAGGESGGNGSPDTEFKVVTPNDFATSEDARLWLRPAPDKVRWFDPETRESVRPAESRTPAEA